MQLLTELLHVQKQTDAILLENVFLTLLEDMGNLNKLGLGALVNAFKQTFKKTEHGRHSTALQTTEVGSKFVKYSGVGRDSPIVDWSETIKKWPNFKKAYLSEPNVRGAAIYLNDKPVALLVARPDDMGRSSASCGLAWDLSRSGISEEDQNELLRNLYTAAYTGDSREVYVGGAKSKSEHIKVASQYVDRWDKKAALEKIGKKPKEFKEVPFKDYTDWVDYARETNTDIKFDKSTEGIVKAMSHSAEVGTWDKKAEKGFVLIKKEPFSDIDKVYGKPKNFQGVTQTIQQFAQFMQKLCTLGIVTVKLVLKDEAGEKLAGERVNNRPTKRIYTSHDSFWLAQDLKQRLARYKASKVEKIEDVQSLVQKILNGELKQFTFAGSTYKGTPKTKYLGSNDEIRRRGNGKSYRSFYDSTMSDLFNGKEVTMEFESDRNLGQYHDLRLAVKLKGGALQPVSISYENKDGKFVKEKIE